MTKFRVGVEPYTAKKVDRWIVDRFAPTTLPQSDHIWRAYELPSGAIVTVPGPSAASRPLATGSARKIATELGMSYEEFREAMGHPIVHHGKPKRKAQSVKPTGCTKGETRARSSEIRSALTELDRAIAQGDRDPAVYMRAHERQVAALTEINRAIEELNRKGAPGVH